MPKSSTRYLAASKTRRAKGTHNRKLSWRSGEPPCSAAEARPETLPCLHARWHAWKLAGSSPGPAA
eukprot:2506675-Pyramimonas_sp.AAC.1